MTPLKARLVLLLIALLFAGVIGNALYDQGARPTRFASQTQPAELASLPALAQSQVGAGSMATRLDQPMVEPNAGSAALVNPPDRQQTIARVTAVEPISEAPAHFGESDRTTSRLGSFRDPFDVAALNASDPEPSNRELVLAIQRELLARNYAPGGLDGVPGLVTRAAILAFEHDAGLRLTGIASEHLLKQLILGPSPGRDLAAVTAEPTHVASMIIAHVHEQLLQLGYEVGVSRELPSPPLAAAIRRFEFESSLPTTGRISGRLVAALARRSGKRLAVLAQ